MNYNVYIGDNSGGPVDYSAAVGTLVGVTQWATPPLPAPSSTRVAVRAVDPATGLEETNVDCVATIVIDAAGHDVSLRPAAPIGLAAAPGDTGQIIVTWRFFGLPDRQPPDDFAVYATPAGPVSYAAPAAVVLHGAGRQDYALTLAGLTPGVLYSVAVRARITGAGDDGNPAATTATPRGAPPANVMDLTGYATHGA